MSKIILRFDDITPGMSWSKFIPLKRTLDKLGIKSILGVVPDCRDKSLSIENPRSDFFDLIRGYKESGDTIVQHGTFHKYTSDDSGLLGINKFSEFSGLDFSDQKSIIQKGKEILINEGVWEPYFMAPAHSFDTNTLKALKDLDFLAITDGYGFYPYMLEGLLLIPQLTSFHLPVNLGVQTMCIHVNGMDSSELESLSKFLSRNKEKFISFEDAIKMDIKSSLLSSSLRFLSKKVLSIKRNNLT